MFRWSFLVPRLLAVLAICFGLRFGLDPFLQRMLVLVGQAATGAKVDIGAVQADLVRGRLHLAGVQVANPRAPTKNLAAFDGSWLDLEMRALVERRFVVSQGTIAGLRWNTDRTESGALPKSGDTGLLRPWKTEVARRWKADLSRAAGDWLDNLAARFTADLEAESAGIRLAKELGRRWPNEYQQLVARVEDSRNRVDRLRQLANDLREKPLEHLEDVQAGLQDLEALRREIVTVRGDAEGLQERLLADRDAVRQAAREDLAKIREKLRMPKLDDQQLTEYLLGDELLARLQQVEEWFARGQTLARYVAQRPEINHERGRGTDVLFGSNRRGPDFLVRSVFVRGSGLWDDQPVEFVGRLQGVTHQPDRFGQPARIQLATQGGLQLQLDALVDLTPDVPRYLFVVNCPAIAQPDRVVGSAERVAMSIGSGTAHVWARVELVGDAMTGEVRWRQDGVKLEPIVSDRCGGRRLQTRLAEALAEIDSVQGSVGLVGTITRPQCQIRSNLGPLVVRGLQTAVQHELQAVAQELAAKADKAVQTELARLDELLKGHRDRLLARLADEEQRIESVKQELAANVALPPQLKLPPQLQLPNGWGEPPVRVGNLFDR